MTQFKPFTESDHDAFMGVESDTPLIAEDEDNLFVLDDHVLVVVSTHPGEPETNFMLGDLRAILSDYPHLGPALIQALTPNKDQ